MRIISWNVNGIRAVIRKNFFDWNTKEDADIVCLQEVKARQEQVEGLTEQLDGRDIAWNAAERPGYSGVATFSKTKPLSIQKGFGIEEFDREGRILLHEYENFYLYNIYFPNGQRDQERLDYKMAFYDAYLEKVNELKASGKAVITCGDYNTAHKEIDLKNPKENSKTSGFLPIEREWIDKYIANGYVDTFRMFNQEPGQYTWWTYRFGARSRNVGWRIDYFFIDEVHKKNISNAFIHMDTMGSDHCPLGVELQF